ncbi:MAG: 50S ribosomal protein L33 [bacterium]
MAAKKGGKKKKVMENIKLVNPITGFIYYKKKNKKLEGKLSLKKYDPVSRKHEVFSEKKF